MKSKFNHIKGRNNLFLHRACDLYLLQGDTNWYTLNHIKNMLTDKRSDQKQLEVIFAGICRRCFTNALKIFAKENVLPLIEI